MKRLLREPLFHFLLLGALLFAVYHAVQPGSDQVSALHRIELTLEELNQLNLYFQSQWRRQPTMEEFNGLVESKVREEILYREALAMGLDKDDVIVKRRMGQKMQFLAEDVAAAREPTTAELKAWYQKNSARFALPDRLNLRHLYFSPDKRGGRARVDAERALARLAGQPQNSKLGGTLADPFMFQDYYGDRTPEQLGKEFGPQFAQAVAQLKPGSWQGPVESGYGWHLIFVDTVVPGRVPAFEEIESDVKTTWLGEQKAQALRKAYDDMRAKYTVLLPAAPQEKRAPAASREDPR